ncbi:MAG: HAMP domain-containing protein [Candidatus Dormibacteraeota bacterium]|nr:HAMP domain-containing protein [Candidatus Dormibacteraeota bacterium]
MALRHALGRSLATRLLVGGLAFTLVVIAGISGLVLLSRNQQTNSSALSSADNRAAVAQQLIERITEPEAVYGATSLARLPALQASLASAGAGTALQAEFSGGRLLASPGLNVVILDARGLPVYSTECDTTDAAGALVHPAVAACESRPGPHVTSSTQSAQLALAAERNDVCHAARAALSAAAVVQCPQDIAGTELLGSSPAFDAAVPVYNAIAGSYAPLGVVVYSSPLAEAFAHFAPVIGYTPAFLGAGGQLLRFSSDGAAASGTVDPALTSALHGAGNTTGDAGFAAHAIYTVGQTGQVAGSFVPLLSPGDAVAGFVGVEVPLSVFAAGTAQDERTIAEVAITAMLLVAILVLLFVDRFVRRPVARLERSVSRIADGDYSSDVPVTSHDELGRLATSVNRMRERIAGYVHHVDSSLQRLQDVSRALTTTTGGVERLQDAVLHAAAATVGGAATALLFERRGDELCAVRFLGDPNEHAPATRVVRRLLRGETMQAHVKQRHLLAVPMFFQESVTGALLTVTEKPVFESDQRALEALANNAAVAVQNALLFEQQKEAVERLRELNRIQSDFLGTAQHELRTPVLTIQGQLDLLAAGWDRWDDAERRELVSDIDISTRLLGELLETIVDFSLLNADTVELRLQPVDIATAVQDASDAVAAHFKGGLPVKLLTDVPGGTLVEADPARLRQVLRAVLDNAVKFTPAGGTVAIHASRQRDGGRCRIDVIDTGVGVAEDALPRVFDRFFQEDNSRTRRFGGMGLGLSLARRLCEAHGAVITLESTQGVGTRCTLSWPLSAAGAASPAQNSVQFSRDRVA